MNKRKLQFARLLRVTATLLVIGLEFTNAAAFLAHGGNIPNDQPHSQYLFQFGLYGVCILILLLDRGSIKRMLERSITRWMYALLLLQTWAMVVRTFNPPVGLDSYIFIREFGLRVNDIGFLLICLLILDDRYVLHLTKKAVVLASLMGVCLNIYDFLEPGFFSDIPGRAAGFYVQPNGSGMALVFGCLVGLTVIQRRWVREAFTLCVLLGIVLTFSREALLGFSAVVALASWSGVLSLRRVALIVMITVTLFVAFDLKETVDVPKTLSADTWSRLTFDWTNDISIESREQLAARSLESFTAAPLLGQGFGTSIYWQDAESHNSFLTFLADCGILGILVIPGLIFSIRHKSWDFFAFALTLLLWGLFYHDVLNDYFALVCIAIQGIERHLEQTGQSLTPYRFPFGLEPQIGALASFSAEQ